MEIICAFLLRLTQIQSMIYHSPIKGLLGPTFLNDLGGLNKTTNVIKEGGDKRAFIPMMNAGFNLNQCKLVSELIRTNFLASLQNIKLCFISKLVKVMIYLHT